MSEPVRKLFHTYQEVSAHCPDVHEQMWERYDELESPGYNVFMCLLHALETCPEEDLFVRKVDDIVVCMEGTPVYVNVDYMAMHMMDTLLDMAQGEPMKKIFEL